MGSPGRDILILVLSIGNDIASNSVKHTTKIILYENPVKTAADMNFPEVSKSFQLN